MKCLVTGGAGYIGPHVVLKLIEQGHEVDIIDNLSTGSTEPLDYLKIYHGWDGEFLKSDIGDMSKVGNLLQKKEYDICFHFAGLGDAGESVRQPIKYFENNVSQFPRFISALAFHGVNNFVLSSSAAVYGEQTTNTPVTEKYPLNPANPYGITKMILEQILDWYSNTNPKFKYTALRYFNVIGSNIELNMGDYRFDKKESLVSSCLSAAAGIKSTIKIYGTDYNTKDGTCIRDYIHVDDLADAHIIAMEEDNLDNKCYNLGNGIGYSVREVVNSCLKITGKDIPVEEMPRKIGDIEYMCADASAFKNKTGWQPKIIDIDDMTKSAWNWIKKVKHIP